METLFRYSNRRIDRVNTDFKRYLWHDINWDSRLIGITGARGAGKTTLLLQYLKDELHHATEKEKIFVNLDDLYFTRNTLIDFADQFVKQGGKYLFLDEVHKYPGWSKEIKNIYDYFDELKIVFTGSSALDIYKGNVDLSRRALHYKLYGLSFREYLELKHNITIPVISLKDILEKSDDYARSVLNKIKPLKYFNEYLAKGYYPFFKEDEKEYHRRLQQTINHVLENDLPVIARVDHTSIFKLKKLFSILADLVPYKPNISKLSKQVEVSRETLVKYLLLLESADLLALLKSDSHGINRMNKPEKIYLSNPNMMFALTEIASNPGTIREVFFYNQLLVKHKVRYSSKADFTIDSTYTFEIGGKSKGTKQIAGLDDAFIAADNIEYPYQNKIPLWLFGFLY